MMDMQLIRLVMAGSILVLLAGCGGGGGFEAPVVGVPVSAVQSSSLPPLASAPASAPLATAPVPNTQVTPAPSAPVLSNLPVSSEAGLPAGAPPALVQQVQPRAATQVVASAPAAGVARPALATGLGPSTPQIMAGEWSSTDRNSSSTCRISLAITGGQPGYRASPYGCTSQDLFRVSGWTLRGDDLVLTASGGVQQVLLSPRGPNRFEGIGVSGERFVLWR
jgi:hypothetical protein